MSTSLDLAYKKALDEAKAILRRRPGKRLSEAVRDYAAASEIAVQLSAAGIQAVAPRGHMPTAFATGSKGRVQAYHTPSISIDAGQGSIGVYSHNMILRTSGSAYFIHKAQIQQIVDPAWHVV
jgi:hypothetical protein